MMNNLLPATTFPTHRCIDGQFSCCSHCGRPGAYAFGPNVRPRTAEFIERTFEFVESHDEPFRLRDLSELGGVWWSAGYKVLRFMEHHGWIIRVSGPNARPVVWKKTSVGMPYGMERAS